MTTVVGIVGPSYCGSTIFERILGRYPGVQSVGESHWLIDGAVPWRRRCSYCGEAECEIFSSAVLQHAKDNADHWFSWLSAVLGKPQVLLSSDKNVVVYDRIGVPDKVIVLYRDPIAWCTSWVVNAGRKEERYAFNELPRLADAKLEKAALQFKLQYTRIYDWLKQHKLPYLVVNMNALVDEPRAWVSGVCKRLGLQFLPESLNVGDSYPLHTLGGNPDVVFKRAPKILRNNLKWRKILTVHQHRELKKDVNILETVKRLSKDAKPGSEWLTCA